jgi:hypothetical protein
MLCTRFTNSAGFKWLTYRADETTDVIFALVLRTSRHRGGIRCGILWRVDSKEHPKMKHSNRETFIIVLVLIAIAVGIFLANTVETKKECEVKGGHVVGKNNCVFERTID